MQQLTTAELKQKISEGENFVLDLFATWCGPCKIMLNNLTKVNESLIKESNGSPVYKMSSLHGLQKNVGGK
jgi:thiol-disulfide isomerase/thioredoxin